MRKRRLIIVGSLLFVLLTVTTALVLSRRAAPLHVTASFLSYTNDTNGVRLAAVAITNKSYDTIIRLDIYCPEIRQQPGLRSTLQLGPRVFLAPGQSEVVAVPTPTNQGEWRMHFFFTRDGWRRRFSDWCGQGSGGLVDVVVPLSLRGVPTQRVPTEWIEP